MCLIVLARQVHPDYPLIVLAHRDEFTARPSQPLTWWPDASTLAGRDLAAGGTWLGAHRNGRFAAVTNVREGPPQASARSRGELVPNWLHNPALDAEQHQTQLAAARQYSGFNLLFGDWHRGRLQLHYSSNRFPGREVAPGIWALSNGEFDAPWPKARRAKAALADLLDQGSTPAPDWLDALADDQIAADHELPDTGIGLDKERWLSPMRITGPHYGTRAATLLSLRADGELQLHERSLAPELGGQITAQHSFNLKLA